MTRHPLLIAVLTTDLLTFLLVLAAAVTAFRIALHWDPKDTGEGQLRLQTQSETAALAIAWAFGLHLFATAALVYGLTNLLPDMVPGAMCGTGVIQAMHSGGPRMVIFRLLGLVILWVWRRMEKVNQSQPEGPLVPINARLILLALPVFGLALQAFWQASLAMDLQQPVDCCAVIYDQFASRQEALLTMGVASPIWLTVFGGLTVTVAAGALVVWQTPTRRRLMMVLPVLAGAWLPVAAITLVRILSAGHYGVLHHHCPWCLFLPEHHLAGFPIWAAWMLVAMETPAVLVLATVAVRQPAAVGRAARHQAGYAARNSLLAILLFAVLAAGPTIWWRLHFGNWLIG
ncbi:MAG: hypothetical protein PVJ53_09750 [Desulfobacterales bacterium]|jgi:hypothetical protein